jgi:uncharacterized surface protein with fasciclin (FAS1) repeats
MKFNSYFKYLCVVIIFISVSCDYDDDSGQPIDPTPSTFEIISESEDHTILEEVLIETGLDEVLNSGTFTVFAPNDDAFDAIDLTGLSNEDLTNILLYHVINGNASSNDFGNSYIKTNATEAYSESNNFLDLYVNVDGGVTLNGVSNVILPDNQANNGNVHVVDAVLTLPNVVTLIEPNPDFTNLATALMQENLIPTLSTNAQTDPAPFTVLAPDNNAFDNFIAEDNGIDDLQAVLDSPDLIDILTYHVVQESALRADDLGETATLTSLQGETFTINTTDQATVTDQNDRVTNIIVIDLTAANGVVHVSDNVLLPTLN